MAYHLVTTEEQQAIFDDIAKGAWRGQGWRYDEIEREGLYRYLIRNRADENFVGTFELLLYVPGEDSFTERDYPFHKESEVKRQTRPIYELDKLAVKKEFRSNENLFTLMQDLMLVSKNELQSDLLLSLVNPYFYGILNQGMNLPVIGLTEPLHCDESDAYFIPSLCYVPQTENDLRVMYQSMADGLSMEIPQ